MLGWLILVFILLPLADFVLLLRVGGVIGFLPTIALAIGTGILGAAMARRQGLGTLVKINRELSSGRVPTAELAEGLLILLAGAVLICPGFITDIMGLLLLVPPVRKMLVRGLGRYFESRISITRIHVGPGGIDVNDERMADETGNAPFGARGPVSSAFGGPFASPRPMKYVKNEAMEREPSG
jgi:UPF0716 protein FxsA